MPNRESANSLKYLFIAADKFPPFRVDVSVLFGREMVKRGHHIDWLLQSEAPCDVPRQTTWCGSWIWVGATSGGQSMLSRVMRHVQSVTNDLRMFRLVRENNYDFISNTEIILQMKTSRNDDIFGS